MTRTQLCQVLGALASLEKEGLWLNWSKITILARSFDFLKKYFLLQFLIYFQKKKNPKMLPLKKNLFLFKY